MLKVKNTLTEIKNSFNGLISTLDMAEERMSELDDISLEISKSEMPRERRLKTTEQNIQGPWDNYKRCNMCIMGIPEGEEKEKNRRNTRSNNDQEFLQISIRQ